MLIVNLLSQPVKFHKPGFADGLSRHRRLEGILPESFILMLVIEDANRSLHSKNEVFLVV